MTQDQAFNDLMSERCQCGKKKGSGRSFCFLCFKRLPPKMQAELYRRIGSGYEKAYEDALVRLAATNGAR